MNQLSRLIAILTLLKSRRVLTATELAEKFDVSIRTVYRDIRKLEEAGVPVVVIEGKGYAILDDYTVAPVQFTEEEANALITAEHLVNQSNDASLVNHFYDALTKIKSVMRSSVQEKSELLSRNMHVFNTKDASIASNLLSQIQAAITNFNYIEINYQKLNQTGITFRLVEPVGIYSSENKWILIAWCHLRNTYRAFRIDRIRNFKILDEKFEDRKFDLNAFHEAEDYQPRKDLPKS